MQRLPPPGRYDPLGPTGFPYLVTAGLVILAAGTVYNALRGNFPEREEHDLMPVAILAGGMLVQIALLRIAGFSVATGLLFAATAYAFRERRLYLTVPRLLGLTLPEGPPERMIIGLAAPLAGAG
jgi:putative tricarboxylic transport membrane protein